MTSSDPTALNCQHLGKTCRTRNGVVPALENVSFVIGEREFVCIVGPSGCGKTTLLKLVAGLLEPTTGCVDYAATLVDGRPHCAMVFQEHGLFPWMTTVENVAFGLEMRGVPRIERLVQAEEFIARVGLRSFANSYPHELSVGMRQRAGIARAFVAGAPVLLMDEPFGALDAQTRLVLQEELLRIWKDEQKSVLYVTHDIEEAVLLGDRVLVMTGQPGRIQDEIPIRLGRPRDLTAKERPEVAETKWRIWKMLEAKVRTTLCVD